MIMPVGFNCRFEFEKGRQLFIRAHHDVLTGVGRPIGLKVWPGSSQLFLRAHNETLNVAAVCVCNPDCSPVGINR
jgi:hypothetical protein